MQLLKYMTRLITITKKKCFKVLFTNRYVLRLFDLKKVGHSKVSWRKKKRIFGHTMYVHVFTSGTCKSNWSDDRRERAGLKALKREVN